MFDDCICAPYVFVDHNSWSGVLSLAGVGAAFGWRRAPHIYVGCSSVITYLFCCCLGTGGNAGYPFIRTALLITSATYLGYLALKIAFAGAKIAFVETLNLAS